MPSSSTSVLTRIVAKFVLLVLASLALFAMSFSLVTAQQSGVSIKPATIDKTVDPGDVLEFSIGVENLSDQEATYYLFPRNISGVADGGVPIYATSNTERTGFEIADWITLPVTEIVVPGGGITNFSYIVEVPETASPGAHLGGVFISVEPPEIENSGAAVGYQVVNTLSLRITGDVVEQASIRQFSTGKYLYGSQNVDFKVRIENSGNVLVQPIGPLEIFNMFGKKVGTVMFNETGRYVVPDADPEKTSTREFTDLVWQGDAAGFGRYEALISLVYGDVGAKKTMSSTVTFWILPWNIIGPALGVLAFILIVIFIFVRLYIRRSLQHLNHERRIIHRRRRGGSSATLLLSVVMLTATALFLIVMLALFA